MAVVFFDGGLSVPDADGVRILAAWGYKLNDDNSPATVTQIEDHLKKQVKSVTDATEQRLLAATAKDGHATVGSF